jgi:P-type Cu+ transporter
MDFDPLHMGDRSNEHTFLVKGMLCEENCVSRVKGAAEKITDVITANVDLANRQLRIISCSRDVKRLLVDIVLSIYQTGYEVESVDGLTVVTFDIHEMYCDHCSSTIERCVNALPQSFGISVSLDMNKAFVILADGVVNPRDIIGAIEAVGYDATLCKPGQQQIRITITEAVMPILADTYLVSNTLIGSL